MTERRDAYEDAPCATLDVHSCHLGEGATYDPETDTAWWFDILERRLMEADLATGAVRRHDLPFMGSAMARLDGEDGHLIVADDGLYRRGPDGTLTLVAPLEADDPATRSNDSRVHPSGAFWIGTMGRKAEQGAGAIYRFFRGGVERLYAGVTIPNAICFSPDGATAYFTDTRVNVLMRVAVDPATGAPVGEPSSLYDARGGLGAIDGAVTDFEGLIWAARWGAGAVDAYTPEGDCVRTLRVPAKRSTCPAFVGRGFDRLLVTTAREGLSAEQLRGDPQAGQTFLLTPGAQGRPEPKVRLA